LLRCQGCFCDRFTREFERFGKTVPILAKHYAPVL
jgi:hypothetical protein